MKHSDGRHVVGAYDCGRHIFLSQQLLHCGHSAFESVITFYDSGWLGSDTALLHGFGKRSQAGLRRVQPHGAGYESDMAVAERRQMLYRLPDSVVVIDFENADTRTVGTNIDEDQWNLALGQLIEKRFFDTEGHDCDALHL